MCEQCKQCKTENDTLRARVRHLEEALVWASGSPSFSPEGEAYEGFKKLVLPLLRDMRKPLEVPA